jgi:hypothetical protein
MRQLVTLSQRSPRRVTTGRNGDVGRKAILPVSAFRQQRIDTRERLTHSRRGAVLAVEERMALENADTAEEMTAALGAAVVKCWNQFSHDVQRMLFEAAARDENGFRSALALFLHGHNPRTADGDTTTTEPPPGAENELPPLFPSGRPENRPRKF